MLEQDALKKEVQRLSERAQREDQQKRIAILKEIHAHMYEKSAAYTNLIIVAGYAGSFTVWGLTKDYLTKHEVFWSALLFCISLLVFIFWEVYKMETTSRAMLGLNSVYNAQPAEFEKAILAYKQFDDELRISLFQKWNYILFVSVFSALAGAGILLASFIFHLFNSTFLE
jgi:hypothetical protein